jgi:hypothetical protein
MRATDPGLAICAHEETDDALPDDPRDAIDVMDYGTAARITEKARRAQANALQAGAQHFQDELLRDLQGQQLRATQDTQSIERHLEERLADVKQQYQTKFTQLVEVHRRQAEELRLRWIQNHERAEGVAKKKIGEMLHTSKVLALLESYDSAESLKTRTQENQSEIIAQEVSQCDDHFRKQFTVMIQRHGQQYDALFSEMTRMMGIARGSANLKKTTVKCRTQEEASLSPVKMINDIEKSRFSPVEKRKLIASLSPGKLNAARSPPAKLPETLARSQLNIVF